MASAAHSRPTSAPSSALDTPSSSSLNMTRSSSSDQARVNKRKGTRSVSSLTPAQLARKRANDREAQRAIRARTKDHIERLETELDELRNRNSRDHTVQELMRRNRALEDELTRLRESMGISATSSPYVKNIYDDNMSTGSGAIPSPRTSPYPAGGDYVAAAAAANGQFADYSQAGYVHFPPACETWTATIPAPAPAAAIASNVSSPSSTPAGTPDDLSAAVNGAAAGHYLPTSAPMMGSSSGMGLRGAEEIKMEYVDGNDHGFHDRSPPCSRTSSNGGTPPMPNNHMLPPSFMHQQPPSPWAMYPVYYPVPSTVH